VRALLFDYDGKLYIGGDFDNWGTIAAADHIVTWDGTAYAAMGTGCNDIVYALALHPNGYIYAGGAFTSAGGVANTEYFARWTGAAWESCHTTEPDNVIRTIVISRFGTVYLGGLLLNAGGVACAHVATYSNGQFLALGAGASDVVYALALGPDGMLYCVGNYTSIGGIAAVGIAKWNGASWARLDFDAPGTYSYSAVMCGPADPITPTNYDIYVGFHTTGTAYYCGKVTATNYGSAAMYPTIRLRRVGGTSATLILVRNETTGRELLFDYPILDEEQLTIYLEPTRKRIVSSMFGERPDAILPNCDFGSFYLVPGANVITAFIDTVGAPTMDTDMWWRLPFASLD